MVVLNTPDKQGTTRRKSLESARRQMEKLGKTPAELDVMFAELKPVELKRGSEPLMLTFLALEGARSSGMNGPQPLSYLEIKAYAELMGETFSPWEIEMLRAMDRAYLTATYKMESEAA